MCGSHWRCLNLAVQALGKTGRLFEQRLVPSIAARIASAWPLSVVDAVPGAVSARNRYYPRGLLNVDVSRKVAAAPWRSARRAASVASARRGGSAALNLRPFNARESTEGRHS